MNFSLYEPCEGQAKKHFGTFEHAHLGIRVNALAPGWVRTPMTKGWDDDKDLNAQMKATTPMHRGAEPEEMAGMVLFLCSDAASYVTGQIYPCGRQPNGSRASAGRIRSIRGKCDGGYGMHNARTEVRMRPGIQIGTAFHGGWGR